MFSLSNPKPNPDVIQHVVANVGHASDLLAAILAHTAVISQKRENMSVSDEMTTRETLYQNGFVIQRTNVKRRKFSGRTKFFLQTPT